MNPLLHIRKNVFDVSQSKMALIAGVSQGTISRWESGEGAPDRYELGHIRQEASRRGLAWDDSWFFETPSEAAE
jgi:transcriptional regulator with XRE-family HTH domain